MNKKALFLIVLLIPAVVIAVWIFTVTGNKYTSSNVSSVHLTMPDGSEKVYSNSDDKGLYIDLKNNLTSIDDQVFDENVYSLYTIKFERVQGDETYYLCLSADVKNCIAYDEKGNWYRIDSEYASRFLSAQNVTDVYKYCDIPLMTFSSGTKSVRLSASQGKWRYILFDGSYAEVLAGPDEPSDTDMFIVSGDGFEFEFDIEPDWYNVKIFDGDILVYDGLLDSVAEVPFEREAKLRASVTAQWYEETNSLYNGNVIYDFLFDFDIRAEYSISKENAFQGEVVYINVLNVNDETLDVSTDISGIEGLTPRSYLNGKVITLPIPADTPAGEYHVSVKSDKTALSIPITVSDKNYSAVKVSFVGGEPATSYNAASDLFFNEISSAFKTVYGGAEWIYGLTTPTQKYIDGIEQYWISSPTYGVKQIVDGTEIANRSLGIHYVKSSTSVSLPVRAAGKGIIAFAGNTSLYGNTVIINHGLGINTVYGHLDDVSAFKQGDAVESGDLLGNAAPSAFAVSSAEFFFGVCVDGVFVNPYNFIVEPRSAESADKSEPEMFFINLNA